MTEEINKAEQGAAPNLPWWGRIEQPDYAACNYAFGHLMYNLKVRLTVNGRIHAETYMSAIGLIAGYSAQQATLEEYSRLSEQEAKRPENAISIGTAGGRRYLYGDRLTHSLFYASGRDARPDMKLSPVASFYAVAAGADRSQLISGELLLRHVHSFLGKENEGESVLESQHQPHLRMPELLRAVWPFALSCFDGSIMGETGPLRQHLRVTTLKWRPVIAACCAGRFIYEVKDVLDPLKAYALVMESAIYGTMPTREWIEKPGNG